MNPNTNNTTPPLPDPSLHERVSQRIANGSLRVAAFAVGRVAALTERRIDNSEERQETAEHGEQFYSDLRDITEDVVNEGPNRPPHQPVNPQPPRGVSPSVHASRAGSQNKKRAKMLAVLSGELAYPPVASRLGGLERSVDPRTGQKEPARNRRERQTEKKVAQDLRVIRDKRAAQKSAKAMLGEAGEHSKKLTKSHLRRVEQQDEADYQAGLIDEFEILDRRHQRGGLSVTKPPKTLRRREKVLDEVTSSTGRGLTRKVEKAQERQSKETTKQAKLQTRRTKLIQRQIELESRITTR
jgi:hypothetical protein